MIYEYNRFIDGLVWVKEGVLCTNLLKIKTFYMIWEDFAQT